jgi:hypothetical protein
MGSVPVRLVTKCWVLPAQSPSSTLCNGHTTLGDQQPHVSLAHLVEERPQPDWYGPRETGDEMSCVAGSISLLPVCVMATRP